MANDAMAQLAPFLGEWRLETSLGPPGAVRAVAVFEWALDRDWEKGFDLNYIRES